jgi:hypothetical protein
MALWRLWTLQIRRDCSEERLLRRRSRPRSRQLQIAERQQMQWSQSSDGAATAGPSPAALAQNYAGLDLRRQGHKV